MSERNLAEQMAEIRKVEMPREMQEEAVQAAASALDECTRDYEVAGRIREHFDKKYNPAWHCIVGSRFGGSVAYEVDHFIYFYMRKRAIMLYKWG